MLNRNSTLAWLLFSLSFTAQADSLPPSSGHGIDAMAPLGHWAARVELRTNGYNKWFDSNGKEQKFNAEFDGLNFNGNVFPALAALGPNASLGTSSLNSKASLDALQVVLGYGLQEDLTLGFFIPYVISRSQIDFSVVGGNTGFNPAFNPNAPIGASNFPFAPVGGGATAPVGTAGLKQLITNPIFGYGYAPIENSQTSGISDPTAGVLWRYFKDERSSAILGVGMRFGIAKGDNPDSLVDIPVGDGSNDFRLRMEYFRDLGNEFDLHLLAENFTQLADHATMRVPQPGQLLATAASKERLGRNLGDFQEYDIEVGHRWGDWRASTTGHFYIKGKDKYTSALGTDTSALETNTKIRANQWRAGLSWSGVDAWQRGKFAVPLIIKLEMQDTYGGYNFPKVRDYYLQVTSFF
ncbi:MAG: hypothetical protein PHP57_05610 [Sideroxydans sp.]|nr:hypothetical protein [Sideroxydans sp.]